MSRDARTIPFPCAAASVSTGSLSGEASCAHAAFCRSCAPRPNGTQPSSSIYLKLHIRLLSRHSGVDIDVQVGYNSSPMDTNTLIIVILLVLLLGGGGFFYRGRRR